MSVEQLYRDNRTCLCTVAFLDIVEYSRRSVVQQLELKRRFNALLEDVLASVDSDYRLLLDTGDGAALCFFGDPEEALLVVLHLRNDLHEQTRTSPLGLTVRMGINLGPVRVVKDLNGQYNTIGDGINVAQRIMNFAEPNQLLVSRSFYEVMASLAQEYSQWFNYRGRRTDKHVREYVIYEAIGVQAQPAPIAGMSATPPLLDVAAASVVALAVTSSPVPAAPEPAWPPELLQQVTKSLSAFFGPLAALLVKQAAQHPGDVQDLVQRLAVQIPDAHEQQSFLRQIGACTPTARPPGTPEPTPSHQQASAVASLPPTATWEPEVLHTASQHLSGYLGPLAKILVQRAAQHTASRESLYHVLAEHLTTGQEKTRFLREAGILA